MAGREIQTPQPEVDVEYEIQFGTSVVEADRPSPFQTTKFNFLRPSANYSKPAVYKKQGASKTLIELKTNQGTQVVRYEGSSAQPKKRDYVLIFDGETFVLERIGQTALMVDTRNDSKTPAKVGTRGSSAKQTGAATPAKASAANKSKGTAAAAAVAPPDLAPPDPEDKMEVDQDDDDFGNELLEQIRSQDEGSQASNQSDAYSAANTQSQPIPPRQMEIGPPRMLDGEESSSDSDSDSSSSSSD